MELEREFSKVGEEEEDVWGEVFARLDAGDGAEDGRISCRDFVEWLDTMNFQDSINLEMRQGIPREVLRRLVVAADKDKSGFLDREEFIVLVTKRFRHLEEVHSSRLKQYLRVAAYADHYTWWPPPLFTVLTTVLLVSVHIHHSLLLNSVDEPLPPGPMCSPFILHPGKRVQAWRFFTYSFVHATGFQHLTFNLVLLVLVGLPLEMAHGGLRVGAVYYLAVLAGSLATSLLQPGTFLAGASGGVYALTTAHLASLLLNWREDSLVLRQRLRNRQVASPTFGKVVRLGRLLLVTSILGIDILNTALGPPNSSISQLAHLSGALIGVLVGLVVLRNRRVEHWEVWVKAVCLILATILLLLLLVLNLGSSLILPTKWDPENHYTLSACDNCYNFRRSC